MGNLTHIGWTEKTWNPWHGCRKVSPGCANCYMFTEKKAYGQDPTKVVRSKTTFRDPLKWKEPALIFTCSWSDFFIEEADAWRAEAWDIIQRTPQHTYQILTKRPERVLDRLPWVAVGAPPWEHVWLGVSVETQRYVDERIPRLLKAPAALRFLSCEPLLGPLELRPYFPALDWVIVGGQSGRNYQHHMMEIGWVEAIATVCVEFQIPLFIKQDSHALPGRQGRISDELWKLTDMP